MFVNNESCIYEYIDVIEKKILSLDIIYHMEAYLFTINFDAYYDVGCIRELSEHAKS